VSYHGKYRCLVGGCGHTVQVDIGYESLAREDMLAHGQSAHGVDWIGTGNEQFRLAQEREESKADVTT